MLIPADAPTAAAAIRALAAADGPAYMRTGRPKAPVVYDDGVDFEIGRANVVRDAIARRG